jgi:hypothetical protein
MSNPDSNGSELWNGVHASIQASLSRIDSALLPEIPQLRATGGRSSGKAFTLFSYRTYAAAASNDHEQIVVGVTLRPEGDGYLASGDISGESSGDLLHEVAPRSVPRSPAAIGLAAQQIAEALVAASDAVREALLNPSRMA